MVRLFVHILSSVSETVTKMLVIMGEVGGEIIATITKMYIGVEESLPSRKIFNILSHCKCTTARMTKNIYLYQGNLLVGVLCSGSNLGGR